MINAKQIEKYSEIQNKLSEISTVEQLLQSDLTPELLQQGKEALLSLSKGLTIMARDLSTENEYENSLLKIIDERQERILSFCYSEIIVEEKEPELTLDEREFLIEQRRQIEEEKYQIQIKQEQEEMGEKQRKKEKNKRVRFKNEYQENFMNLAIEVMTATSIDELDAIKNNKFYELHKNFENRVIDPADRDEVFNTLKMKMGITEKTREKDVYEFFETMFECCYHKFAEIKKKSTLEMEEDKVEDNNNNNNNSQDVNQNTVTTTQVAEDKPVENNGEDWATAQAKDKLKQHIFDIMSGEKEQLRIEQRIKHKEALQNYYQSNNDSVVNPGTKQVARSSFFGKLKQISSTAVKTMTTSLTELAKASTELTPPGSGM